MAAVWLVSVWGSMLRFIVMSPSFGAVWLMTSSCAHARLLSALGRTPVVCARRHNPNTKGTRMMTLTELIVVRVLDVVDAYRDALPLEMAGRFERADAVYRVEGDTAQADHYDLMAQKAHPVTVAARTAADTQGRARCACEQRDDDHADQSIAMLSEIIDTLSGVKRRRTAYAVREDTYRQVGPTAGRGLRR
jgi:hypothetical protein